MTTKASTFTRTNPKMFQFCVFVCPFLKSKGRTSMFECSNSNPNTLTQMFDVRFQKRTGERTNSCSKRWKMDIVWMMELQKGKELKFTLSSKRFSSDSKLKIRCRLTSSETTIKSDWKCYTVNGHVRIFTACHTKWQILIGGWVFIVT